MSILCLWSPDWPTDEGSVAEIVPLLLEEAPRVVVEARGLVWVDVRGLPGERVAERLLGRLKERGMEEVRGGLSAVPIVAEGAARSGDQPLRVVRAGEEREFLADLPISLVTDDEALLTLLEGAGVCRCGDLGALTAESVEVRFGAEGVRAWRLARGDDRRVLFSPIPPEQLAASVDFVDYTIRDATRLVFTLNALLDQVCGGLRKRARRARAITLAFTLADGSRVEEVLRTARPTSDRALWMRRVRAALERVRLPQPIAGVALEVGATEPVSSLQGDLFDRGFATASFVEEAVTRLMDMYRGIFVRQVSEPDPLAERRARWVELLPEEIASGPGGVGDVSPGSGGSSRSSSRRRKREREREGGGGVTRTPAIPRDPIIAHAGGSDVAAGVSEGPPVLELQLLSEPKPIRVRARTRRDHVVPVRYLDGREWRSLTAAGPDRISGGHEEATPYAREYYRCVSDTGALLWIYRDAIADRWFLHGWWG